jgi:hypothetical protein
LGRTESDCVGSTVVVDDTTVVSERFVRHFTNIVIQTQLFGGKFVVTILEVSQHKVVERCVEVSLSYEVGVGETVVLTEVVVHKVAILHIGEIDETTTILSESISLQPLLDVDATLATIVGETEVDRGLPFHILHIPMDFLVLTLCLFDLLHGI